MTDRDMPDGDSVDDGMPAGGMPDRDSVDEGTPDDGRVDASAVAPSRSSLDDRRPTGPGGPWTSGGSLRPVGLNVARVGLAFAVAFGVLAAGAGYWQVVDSQRLSDAPDNPAVVAAAANATRGRIVDRNGTVLAETRRDASGHPYRVYRDPAMSQVIGYASPLFGSAGLERTYGPELLGVARPDPVSDLLKKFDPDPTDPQSLTLTISLDLQRAALRGLGSDRGAIVMLDPKTGAILALASTPTYDASRVTDPDSAKARAAFDRLRNDDRLPLLPRATQGQYVPGSVFKIMTAIAALGSDAITASTVFPEQRKAERDGLVVNGFRIREHAGVPVRDYDLAGATEVSSNIFYALAALKTGGQALADWADKLGFGGPIPFELPTRPSQVTNGGGTFGGGFSDATELANAGYGQAETLVTPLQMALVAATVANDGVLMKPYCVSTVSGKASGTRTTEPEVLSRILGIPDARAIQHAMQQAVEGRLGRQFTTGAAIPGVPTAGKSGTAELGGSGEPHSWFIGFAPVEDPQIAIAVLVEQGGRGGARAAPLGGQLMRQYLNGLGRG
jgi:peptidoglycan glycosyltransferase